MARKNNKIPLVILVLICACLLFAMYTSLSTLALAIWGDTVMGTVDRYDNRLDSTNAEPNRSRTIFKGYYFTVKGKGYRGYVIYNSDEAWPRLENGETLRAESIRYLPSFHTSTSPLPWPALAGWERWGFSTTFSPPLAVCYCFGFFSFAPPETIKKQGRENPPFPKGRTKERWRMSFAQPAEANCRRERPSASAAGRKYI